MGNVGDEAIITYIIRELSRNRMYDNEVAKEYKDIYDIIDHVKRCEMHYQMRITLVLHPSLTSYHSFILTTLVHYHP